MKNLISKTVRVVGIVGALAVLGVASHRAPARKQVESSQIQGTYLTSQGTALFHHTAFLDEVLHSISKSGHNEVYINTYGFAGPLFPSKTAKAHPILVPPMTDPLKAAIQESRRQGLKPFAFFEYGLMLNPGMRVAKMNPDWLLTTPQGEKVVQGRVWLDPTNPEVKAYLIGIMKELAAYKDLEGIQLDDHWGIPREFGDYTAEVTALTREVRRATLSVNKNIKLTLCTNALPYTRKNYNQNWMVWVKEGLLDAFMLQAYRKNNNDLITALRGSGLYEASRYVEVGVAVFAGYEYAPFTPGKVSAQVQAVQNKGYGASTFVWEYVMLRHAYAAKQHLHRRLRDAV